MKFLISILCFILISVSAFSESFRAVVINLHDGDTVTVAMTRGGYERIRLDGVDAPELEQDGGKESKEWLSGRINGKTVTVEWETRDMYKRILGTVILDGKNINLELVKAGQAWQYRYNRDKGYSEAQKSARKSRLGIWKMRNPIEPIDFRHSQNKIELGAGK